VRLIDELPERSLSAIKSLLSLLVIPTYTIEAASPQECANVEKRATEYHKKPQNFVPLKSLK